MSPEMARFVYVIMPPVTVALALLLAVGLQAGFVFFSQASLTVQADSGRLTSIGRQCGLSGPQVVKADYGVMFAAPWCPNGENLRYTLQGGKDACVICCPSSDLDACQYQRIDSHDDRCDPEQHGVFMRWLQCPTGLSAGH